METRNAYQLASIGECYSPDSESSPGARFLTLVQESVVEAWDYLPVDERESAELSDMAHEIADGCVPVYTRDIWDTFVDLGAWEQDLDDLGGATSDMEQNAKVSLYLIAERVALTLLEELQSEHESDD